MKIEKPLLTFDLETTGTDVASDRIVSIATKKIFPDGTVEDKYRLVNPIVDIPQEAIDVHGITNDMVKGEPKFVQIAKSIYKYMTDCDFIGFNAINFDLPLLAEEFGRYGIEFPLPDQRLIDVGSLFKLIERRTLSSAYQFYCGKELVDAHNAQADVDATYESLLGMIDMYDWNNHSVEELAKLSRSKWNNEELVEDQRIDLQGKLVRDNEGNAVLNFGKHKGKKLSHPDAESFVKWMLDKDFTMNTKIAIKRELKKLGKNV